MLILFSIITTLGFFDLFYFFKDLFILAVQGLHCCFWAFSLWRTWLLIALASLVVRAQALGETLQALERVSPVLAGRFVTTRPPGNPDL